MIEEYFDFLKKIASTFAFTQEFRLVKEAVTLNRGFIRFIIKFVDGSELHVFEHVDTHLHKTDYSYHWQDKNKKLIKRWDNAAHHPEIKTRPHHMHEVDQIKPSLEPTLTEILKIVENNF
ncbi:hypothetical protein MOTE_24640 [Moorella thermoacetica]|uniref:Uncharacterized protein n=1 Tax=Neomoorella thermoacetica TaxID=1525 RepID=A0A1J5NQZ5_NEOTH|nr:hypothetical protein MOTE_24640 [Moorella thermoacetica]